MHGNSYDGINVNLSLRRFLANALLSKLDIPLIHGLSTSGLELTADKYILYFAQARQETIGIPKRNIDLTIHLRSKFSAMPHDTDGKWVLFVSDIVRSAIQDAQATVLWPTDIILYDYVGLFDEATLLGLLSSGNIDTIFTTISAGAPKEIGCFWLEKAHDEKLERLDTEFCHARNYRLFQYSPDLVRG